MINYENYDPEELIADRKLRFQAVRAVQMADWAAQESEDEAARRSLNKAVRCIFKMKDPSAEALALLAEFTSSINWSETYIDVSKFYGILVYDGEEVNNPTMYGV